MSHPPRPFARPRVSTVGLLTLLLLGPGCLSEARRLSEVDERLGWAMPERVDAAARGRDGTIYAWVRGSDGRTSLHRLVPPTYAQLRLDDPAPALPAGVAAIGTCPPALPRLELRRDRLVLVEQEGSWGRPLGRFVLDDEQPRAPPLGSIVDALVALADVLLIALAIPLAPLVIVYVAIVGFHT